MDEIFTKIAVALEENYQDKYVDGEFMQTIFDDIVGLQGTRNFVKNGFSFCEEEPLMLFATAGFDHKDKKVKFFNTAIRNASYEVNVYIKTLPESKRVFATNLLLVASLLHELEHVNQMKLMIESDSYEAELLRISEGRRETITSYDVMPSERFAESKALNGALSILDKTTIISPDLHDYLEQKLALKLFKGYDDEYNHCQSYPLKQYFDKHGIAHSEISVDESVQTYPSLDDRLFYGMPITDDERVTVKTKAGLNSNSGNYTL